MDFAQFDGCPVLVVIAGPNGAGKTTFFHAHLADAGLPFVNADVLAGELGLSGYGGAEAAAALRKALLKRQESFVFETVFSDPVGEKMALLRAAEDAGYVVILIYIGISGPDVSDERVAMRVSQGGHDVPPEKLWSRFARTLANLQIAVRNLSHVLVYDNENLRHPYRQVAIFEQRAAVVLVPPLPAWLVSILPPDEGAGPA